ncbi:anti-sigma factor [Allosaccharopolyspora coralli]|uniref:Anti-sigma factor n=1 Tax=Allosaccharopolyspora coralli TaxID=2665642 RepID=A0A5Q3QC24_9PSEU|nr:ATP-binding protein [Allosaccharopolyspora coralli]QGK70784.1 anti-sigma factor [Allosaccharopolyspora coralli]
MSAERGLDVSDGVSAGTSHVVEVRVDADPGQLSVLRAVIGDLAMRADFDVDAIADLRLAVDEACSSLVRLASSGSTLVCRVTPEDSGISVTAEALSDEQAGPRTDTFSWRVLTALTDTVNAVVDTDDNGQNVVRLDLTKRRTAGR